MCDFLKLAVRSSSWSKKTTKKDIFVYVFTLARKITSVLALHTLPMNKELIILWAVTGDAWSTMTEQLNTVIISQLIQAPKSIEL